MTALATAEAERTKYETCWESAAYRKVSPGELWAWRFIKMLRPQRGETITDFGSGPGRASLMFHLFGLKVLAIDIAANSLDDDVRAEAAFPFLQANLWEPLALDSDYGFCVDVMEHIPEERVDAVVHNVVKGCRTSLFHISVRPDSFGPKLVGAPLHLTVKPFDWWLRVMRSYGEVTDARDLVDNAMFLVRRRP